MSNKTLEEINYRPRSRKKARAPEIGQSCWTNLFLIELETRRGWREKQKCKRGPAGVVAPGKSPSQGPSWDKHRLAWLPIDNPLRLGACNLKLDSAGHLPHCLAPLSSEIIIRLSLFSATIGEKKLIAIFINCEVSRGECGHHHLDLASLFGNINFSSSQLMLPFGVTHLYCFMWYKLNCFFDEYSWRCSSSLGAIIYERSED